jgi:hypothetical protein
MSECPYSGILEKANLFAHPTKNEINDTRPMDASNTIEPSKNSVVTRSRSVVLLVIVTLVKYLLCTNRLCFQTDADIYND